MSMDYLTSIATKLLGLAPVIRPRVASRFEPLTSAPVPTARAPSAEGDGEPVRTRGAMAPRDRSPRPLPSDAPLAQNAADDITEPEDARVRLALARTVEQREAFAGNDRAAPVPDARDAATSVPERSMPPRARITSAHHASSAGERESEATTSASTIGGTRFVVAAALPTNTHDGSNGSARPTGSAPRETVATGQYIPANRTRPASMPPVNEAEHRVDASITTGNADAGAYAPPHASAAGTQSAAPRLKVDSPAAPAGVETQLARSQPTRVASAASAVPVTATAVTAWQGASRRVPMPDPGRERGERRREPPIHVTIGRIEIRATPSAPAAPTPRRRPPLMGLDEYLRRKGGGGSR
jgi:hypothetical protein